MPFESIRRSVLISVAVSSLIFLTSCNNMLNGKSTVLTAGSGADTQSSKLEFATVSNNVLQPMCLNCHSSANGNSGGVNLETYSNVAKNLESIKADVLDGSMPASGPGLNSDEKNLILTWIEAGAPEFADSSVTPSPSPAPSPQPNPAPAPAPNPQPAPAPSPQPAPAPAPAPNPAPAPQPAPSPVPTPTLNFSTVSAEVLQPKCLNCHSSYSKYSNVKADLASIKSRISSGSMPRGSSLTSQQKTTILNWINAGAPQ